MAIPARKLLYKENGAQAQQGNPGKTLSCFPTRLPDAPVGFEGNGTAPDIWTGASVIIVEDGVPGGRPASWAVALANRFRGKVTQRMLGYAFPRFTLRI